MISLCSWTTTGRTGVGSVRWTMGRRERVGGSAVEPVKSGVIYNAGISTSSKQPAAAIPFLSFLTTPAVHAVITSKGVLPLDR